MIKPPNNDKDAETTMLLVNETTGTTVKSKWIFEIFHGEKVYGIHQIFINGSEKCSKFIGTTKGTAVRFELMNGEEVQKLTFTGFQLPCNFCFVTNIGLKYGPFGTDTYYGRKPVTIQIVNGDVLAQATSFFIDDRIFENVECFNFYVSDKTLISGAIVVSLTGIIKRFKRCDSEFINHVLKVEIVLWRK